MSARAAATGRVTLTVTAFLMASGLLSGCSGSLDGNHVTLFTGTAAPAGVAQPAASTSHVAPSPTPSVTGSSTGSAGCKAGGLSVPQDANQVSTDDMDGDGQNDTLWLGHRGGQRLMGVATASGSRFAVAINNLDSAEAEQRVGDTVSAVAGRLGDGSAVILMDVGRAAVLYAVARCRIVPTENIKGERFTFDMGYAGTGNGVGCSVVDGRRTLVAYLAEYNSRGSTYRVTQTTVKISPNGERATNGRSVVLAARAPETGALVTRATSVSCGASRTISEPES
jgi:hypothetical protein